MDQQNNKTPQDEFSVDAILQQLDRPDASAPGTDTPQENQTAPEPVPAPADTTKTAEKPQKKRKKNGKKQRSRGKGCLVTLIWLIVIGAVSVGLALAALFAVSDYLGVGKDFIRGRETETVQLYVEEGTSVQDIAQMLEDNGIIINKHVFLLYLKLTHKGDNMNYGAHDFSTKMSYNEILASLAQTAKAEDLEVTVPSCKRVDDILRVLEEAGVCSYGDLRTELLNGSFDSPLWNAIPADERMYYAAEGYLFPDTYKFYENDSPHRVIQKMLDNLEEKFTPEMRKAAADRGYTTHQILTMASVVESECNGFYDEMPKVAQVFYNRLEQWPEGQRLLQSDPSSSYPYGNGAYDTYRSEGLPPGPICNMSEAAIKAAVYPDETVTAFYFVTDSNHKFYYNETLSAHEATITELKNKGLWLS